MRAGEKTANANAEKWKTHSNDILRIDWNLVISHTLHLMIAYVLAPPSGGTGSKASAISDRHPR